MSLLKPLGYHVRMRDYLRDHHPSIWARVHYSRSILDKEEEVELLKAGYRLDPESRPDLFEMVENCRDRLEIEQPVFLYQGAQYLPDNALIYYSGERAHILFQGRFLERMNSDEIHSTIAHELGHFKLSQLDDGEFLSTFRILRFLNGLEDPEPEIRESLRLYRLYDEIFADRAELFVMRRPHFAVSTLLKMENGISDPDAERYFNQVDELVGMADLRSRGTTHPEVFIRAQALVLWSRRDPGMDGKIERMIEGPLAWDHLDLLGRAHLSRRTREMVDGFLEPEWARTERAETLARKYFPEWQPEADAGEGPERWTTFREELDEADEGTRRYFTHVLLDLAAADPDLGERAYVRAFVLAETLGLGTELEEAILRERTRKTTKRIRRRAIAMVGETAGDDPEGPESEGPESEKGWTGPTRASCPRSLPVEPEDACLTPAN